ncbi:MAG: synthase subunit [Candidatus Saccharibacteria bacterium]|nr:synthase subunit [Candidatus Saccharibacteria bacterium]
MERIYVIDNGSLFAGNLRVLTGMHGSTTVIPCTEIAAAEIDPYAPLVLSGGPINIYGNESRYAAEIELIQNHRGPIIGICLGFEMIAVAYGEKLVKLPSYVGFPITHNGVHAPSPDYYTDVFDIPIATYDDVLEYAPGTTIKAFKSHGWAVQEVGDEFKVLARSGTGIEIMRHASKPIWGFQFHPEIVQDNTAADIVFHKIMKSFVKEDAHIAIAA